MSERIAATSSSGIPEFGAADEGNEGHARWNRARRKRSKDGQTCSSIVLILIDPDSHLADPEYRRKRRAGLIAFSNSRAFSRAGEEIWAAEMPAPADYCSSIVRTDPIEVPSFPACRCRLDVRTGRLLAREFMK